MKLINTIKRIAYSSTFVFTVTIFIFMAMFAVIEEDASVTQTRAIPLSNYPWILLFSVIVGSLDNFLTAKSVPLALRLPVHFVGVMGAFYVIILRIFGLGQHGRGRFSVMLVAAIIYTVAVVIGYLHRKLMRNLEAGSEQKKQLKAQAQEQMQPLPTEENDN